VLKKKLSVYDFNFQGIAKNFRVDGEKKTALNFAIWQKSSTLA
jgi:hypothetical protein